MGQGGGLGQRGVEGRRWRTDRGAQGAIQLVARGGNAFILPLHHQLHAARAGTDEIHALGVDHGGSNGHADSQREPHQHEAGEVEGVTKLLHNEILVGVDTHQPTRGFCGARWVSN